MILHTDGSYTQYIDEDATKYTAEEITAAGIFTCNDKELIANEQWKCVLNDDGTLTLSFYENGEYNIEVKTLIKDE